MNETQALIASEKLNNIEPEELLLSLLIIWQPIWGICEKPSNWVSVKLAYNLQSITVKLGQRKIGPTINQSKVLLLLWARQNFCQKPHFETNYQFMKPINVTLDRDIYKLSWFTNIL